MTPELKTAWIAALRSGEYKQGRSLLKVVRETGTYHCCLGVLAEVAGLTFNNSECGDFHILGDPENENSYSFLSNATGLPVSSSNLITLNDTDELSFYEIADWIETNVKTEGP